MGHVKYPLPSENQFGKVNERKMLKIHLIWSFLDDSRIFLESVLFETAIKPPFGIII